MADDFLSTTVGNGFKCLVGDHHKLKGFGRFEREVNEEFDKMMKSASERLIEMCKIEKRVWNKHEDAINQYDDLIAAVDLRTEEQVCSRITLYRIDIHN